MSEFEDSRWGIIVCAFFAGSILTFAIIQRNMIFAVYSVIPFMGAAYLSKGLGVKER